MAEQSQGLGEYLSQLEQQRAVLTIQIAGARLALGMPPEEGVVGAAGPFAGHQGHPGPAGVGGGVGSSPQHRGPAGVIRPDQFFRMSIPEAVQAYLAIMKQPQSPKAISDGLKAGGILSESKHFYANVFTSLKRLRTQGLIVNTKTGGWGLAEWYAGRSGAGISDRPKRRRKGVKGAKRTKGSTKKAADSPTPPKGQGKQGKGAYQAFLGEQIKAGKNMAQAAAAWREHKGGHDHES